MSVVLGSQTIKAFVVSPDKFKVLGIVRIGMEFGLLATTECGSYVRVNGSTVSALNTAEVQEAIRAACANGRGEPYLHPRPASTAPAPLIVMKKHRHAQPALRCGDSDTSRRVDMDTRKIKLIRESWALVPWKSEALSGNFYIHLFNLDPDVQTAYAANKVRPVSGMLGFIGVAVTMLDDEDALRNMLRQASKRHVSYGALRSYYPVMGEALLLTLEGALGNKFPPETRQAWAEFYQFLSDCMSHPLPDAGNRFEGSVQRPLRLEDLLGEQLTLVAATNVSRSEDVVRPIRPFRHLQHRTLAMK